MALPGDAGGVYAADGLEHNEAGVPSSLAADHQRQLAKRRRKLEGFDYGSAWAEIRGEEPLCILPWGSSAGVVLEAAARMMAAGRPVRVIALRLLAPLNAEALAAALGAPRASGWWS
jgi:2-oxoglutarate ferredoxin oxidoreductase subunit alpha